MMSLERTDRARVLVLIKGLGIGGAERLVAEAARYWDRETFHYRVAYVLPWKDQLVPDLNKEGITVDCIGGASGLDLATPIRLRRLLRDVDLVHAHLPTTGILARLMAREPVVYTEHNLARSYRQPTRTLNRLTFGRNQAVTAVSEAVAQSLKGFPGPRPTVVANGVAVSVTFDEIAAVRRSLGVAAGRPLVAHVGNIRPHKGHEMLIRAASRLAVSAPDALIVSAGGEKFPGDLARVRSLAAAAGVGDRIRFLGRIEDARPLLAAADMVVNPSDVEGLPLVLLEALALARPVIATAVGGVPSVVIDGKTGRLIRPGDPDALARAIAEVLGHPSEARAWGEAGAQLVKSEYGVSKMVKAFEDIYRQLLKDTVIV